MMIKGACESVDASKAIRKAEDALKTNESQVNDNRIKVSNYQSKISTIQNEIKTTDKVLNKIQRQIEEVKQHLEVTADFQQVVRRAVTLLSVLRGRVTVLERQTQRSIHWEPVIKCMEEVMKATGNVAENRLLYRQGVPGFINALRENVGGLLSLCNSPNNSEYDSYYQGRSHHFKSEGGRKSSVEPVCFFFRILTGFCFIGLISYLFQK